MDKKKRTGLLQRITSTDHQTLGLLTLYDEHNFPFFLLHTLELPWRDNKTSISCIPAGIYWVELRWSRKYKFHFHIKDVQGRELILIHNANYVRQLEGCIAVGDSHTDIDGDGYRDVTNSVDSLKLLLDRMPDRWKLTIKDVA